MMQRRQFLQSVASLGAAAVIQSSLQGNQPAFLPARAPRILLRSSWQIVNIGDVAHTPGVLALIAFTVLVILGAASGIAALGIGLIKLAQWIWGFA